MILTIGYNYFKTRMTLTVFFAQRKLVYNPGDKIACSYVIKIIIIAIIM